MFKLLTTAFAALMLIALPAQAAPSKKIFKGNYDGSAAIENVVGDAIFYRPLRFKISKTGKITGTAYRDHNGTEILLTVKGSIRKVKSRYRISAIGNASGTFSDGTKWKAKVSAYKGIPASNGIIGTASNGDYRGNLALMKQL